MSLGFVQSRARPHRSRWIAIETLYADGLSCGWRLGRRSSTRSAVDRTSGRRDVRGRRWRRSQRSAGRPARGRRARPPTSLENWLTTSPASRNRRHRHSHQHEVRPASGLTGRDPARWPAGSVAHAALLQRADVLSLLPPSYRVLSRRRGLRWRPSAQTWRRGAPTRRTLATRPAAPAPSAPADHRGT